MPIQLKSANFRYAITYVLITSVVLFLLNIYCSKTSQDMFYNSTKTSMLEKCSIVAGEISKLEILTNKTVSNAISGFENLNVSRIIVTDYNGCAVYDSVNQSAVSNKYILYPEVVSALSGNDVVIWNYHNGVMQSRAAVPVYSYGTLLGCIYLTEHNVSQGALIASLQNNVFTITAILEVIVILSALIFSTIYSGRLRKIMASIRAVRQGDYSQSLQLKGHDELNTLGDEFNDLIRKLKISENTRNQFVSDASHELKTPLASIKLLTDSILQNNMDEETIKEFVGDIGNEADRLNRMSQKLLTLSRTDLTPDNDLEITSICPTIERVVRMLSVLAEENGVCIVQRIEEDNPVLLIEDDLYQIIFNLVENGIKYNRRGGQLEISLSREGENTVLRIHDTGVGIPQDSLPHIFKRFYRVDKARSRSSGGSGLGLSIVRNMVERNNGEITVESKIGEGTTFTLAFPIFDIGEDEA